jgi:LCP family protein required for cell wall assembly
MANTKNEQSEKEYRQIPNQENVISEQEEKPTNRPAKKRRVLKLFTGIIVFFLTVTAVFSSQVLMSEEQSTSWFNNIPIIKQIKHLAESADKQLKGEERDRINILLLGMGGKNHQGGYLTDTIILASLEPSTKKVAMISIPRDMAVPMEDRGWQKINHVNAYAEMEEPGSGGVATSQAISDILETPIDYFVRVDFDGFINIIDEIGGVKVEVENTLNDYSYPIMGREDAEPYESRFEHLHIEKGWQTMDGKLALKYARSRHAAGVEGSDFARAKRQQKIIQAAKDKLLSLNTLLNPGTLAEIVNQYQEHVDTNLKIWEIVKLWNNFKHTNSENITSKVIDNGPNGLLKDTISEQGAYLLLPRSGDFAEIQYFVHNVFSDAPNNMKTQVTKERATVEVLNGTWVNGLASQAAVDLEKYGFTVSRVGNCSQQKFNRSMIYDLTYGEKMNSLEILKEKTGAEVSFGLPDWLVDEISDEIDQEKTPIKPDFILVLGQNADASGSGAANPEQ